MQKILLIILFLLLISACGRQTQQEPYQPSEPYTQLEYTHEPTPDPPMIPSEPTEPPTEPPTELPTLPESVLDFALAARLFAAAEEKWDADNGELWGVPLHVPLVIVDGLTRDAAANRPFGRNTVRHVIDGNPVYIGTVPAHARIGTTRSNFYLMDWGMITWDFVERNAEQGEQYVLAVLLHEGFHVTQPSIHRHSGFSAITGGSSTKGAQNYYVLEVAALVYAWHSTGEERLSAINDALHFRNSRRATYRTLNETQIEIGEGLVVYTAELMLMLSREEISVEISSWVERMLDSDTSTEDTISLLWGYSSGAMYALLLDEFCADWRRGMIRSTTDLGQLLQYAAGIREVLPPTDPERFGYTQITTRIAERVAEFESRALAVLDAIAQPQIRLPVIVGYGRETGGIFILPERFRETHYRVGTFMLTSGTVMCNWGRLELESGYAIVNWGRDYMLSAPTFEVTGNRIYGDGWVLELNDGWRLYPMYFGYAVSQR